MSDSQYIALGFGLFVAACGAHLAGWQRLLAPALRSADVDLRARVLKRWAGFIVALQLSVLVLCGAWVLAMAALRPRGYAWSAPPLGLLIGAALPLQLEVFGIMRASRR